MTFGSKSLQQAMDRTRKLSAGTGAPLASPIHVGVTQNPEQNDKIERLRQEQIDRRSDVVKNIEQHNDAAYRLNSFVEKRIRAAMDTKCQTGVQHRLEEAYRFKMGTFSHQELSTMACGPNNALWFPLVEFMDDKMHSFLRSTLSNDKEYPRYDMRPTTEPDVPPALLQNALDAVEQSILLQIEQGVLVSPTQVRELVEEMADNLFDQALEASRYAVKKCKRALDDRLDESRYYTASEQCLKDLTLYGTSLLYGPFPSIERKAQFTPSDEMKWGFYKSMEWRALDPHYFFPSVDSTDGQDGEYWVYVDHMTAHQLYMAKSCDGWIAHNIDQILIEHPDGHSHLRSGAFAGIAGLRGICPSQSDMRFEVYWYHGYVTGDMLIEHGVTTYDGKQVDGLGRYDVMVKCCAGLPICIQKPLDPKMQRPLHVAKLYDMAGTFWARGVYDRLRDSNRVANSALSSLPIDMAFQAQGVYEIDRSLLVGDDDMDLDVFPGMIVEKDTGEGGLSGDAFKAHRIGGTTGTFMQTIREVVEHAEQLLGLPRYLTGGAQGSGALRTASGLQQLQSNAFVGLEAIIVNIDHGMTKPAMSMLHRMLVQVTEDPDIVGDTEVVVMGAAAMLARQTRRDELIGYLPLFEKYAVQGVIPPEIIMDILREIGSSVGIDGRQLIPNEQYEQAKQLELQQAMTVLGLAGGGQGGTPPGVNPQQVGGAQGGAALPGAAPPQLPQLTAAGDALPVSSQAG